MSHDLVPGAVFPDYQLPDHTGTPRRLSELQGENFLSSLRKFCAPKMSGLDRNLALRTWMWHLLFCNQVEFATAPIFRVNQRQQVPSVRRKPNARQFGCVERHAYVNEFPGGDVVVQHEIQFLIREAVVRGRFRRGGAT